MKAMDHTLSVGPVKKVSKMEVTNKRLLYSELGDYRDYRDYRVSISSLQMFMFILYFYNTKSRVAPILDKDYA